MFAFKDKSGLPLASKDGIRVELLKSDALSTINDLESVSPIPADSSTLPTVTLGNFAADFFGIKSSGNLIVKW